MTNIVDLFARRTFAVCLSALLTVCSPPAASVSLTSASIDAGNPIPAENLLPGNEDWDLVTFAGNQPAEEGLARQEVVGYASDDSVSPGGTITFHISVSPTQGLEKIEFYRLGHYQRLGGRQVFATGPIASVTNQPQCPLDGATGKYECSWPSTYVLNVPTTWLSGIYIAKPYNDNGFTGHITFVVRDDARTADVLFVLPMMSHAAYNSYPLDPVNGTGKRLFDSDSHGLIVTESGTKRAVKVSLDRPQITSRVMGRRYGANDSIYDTYWIRWFERNGYNITYASDIDVHETPGLLKIYPLVVMGTGAEYWTGELFTAFEQARDAGVHLIFAGAANALWQVRLEPNAAGKPNRTVVGYKDAAKDTSVPGPQKSIQFRDPLVNRAEQRLVGVMFDNGVSASTPASYTVANAGHWAYAGTGLTTGSVITNQVGALIDKLNTAQTAPVSTTYVTLANSIYNPPNGVHNSSIYTAPSGAMVWATGTSAWAWALERVNVAVDPELSYIKPVVRQITQNIVDGMLASPVKVSGLTANADPSTRLGDSSRFTATVATGANVSYNWSFGDGTTGAGAAPSHTYLTAGSYTALVTATNAAGVTTATVSTLVTNAAPVAEAGPNQNAGVGAAVTLSGAGSTDPDGHTPLTYRWSQLSGPVVALTGANTAAPSFTAPGAPATLQFSLLVTDARGLAASGSSIVTVIVANTTISGLSATSDTPATVGVATRFTATIGAGSSVTYTWRFGDGVTATGPAVSHVYTSAGRYTATVTAINSLGGAVATTTIQVLDVPAQALSISGPITPALGAPTVFTAGVSAGTGLTYTWSLSGPATSTVSGPSFTFNFTQPGVYTLTLISTNSAGTSRVTRQITVAGSGFRALAPLTFK
jgi:PKD repeat protein